MTIRTHTHTCTPGPLTGMYAADAHAAHAHRTGYTTARGADTYVSTHTAPDGRTYVTVPTTTYAPSDRTATTTYDVWCVVDPTDGIADVATPAPTAKPAMHPTAPLATRYGVAIRTVHAPTAFIETADGMGYASRGTDTHNAPTVPATHDTPADDTDRNASDAHYAATFAHARGADRDRTAEFAATRAAYADVPDAPTPAMVDPSLLFADPAPSAPITESDIIARFATAPAAHAWIADNATYTTPRTYHGTDYTVPTDAWGNTYGVDTVGRTYTVWVRPADGDGYINADGVYVTYPTDRGTPVVAPSAPVDTAPVGAPTPVVRCPRSGAPTADGAVCPCVTRPGYHDAAPVGAPTPDTTCRVCGTPAVPLDTAPVGARVTIHTYGGVGRADIITRTGTVSHETADADTDDPWTYVVVTSATGHRWMTARSDYIVHVDAPAPTADETPVADADADRDMTDDDARAWGVDPSLLSDADDAPTGMVPGRIYTGTVNADVSYTVTTDGTVTTRAYTRTTDGVDHAAGVTYADANHMWTAPDAFGDTITYVVAERTYWRTYARAIDSVRVSSVAWVTAGGRACGHSFAAYGACVAPYGHPHADHVDANGHTFTGPAITRYAGTYGPVAPDTYDPATTPHTYTSRSAGRDARTVLHADVAAMVRDYRHIMTALGHPFPTDGAAYAALVRTIADGTYDPSPVHYAAWSVTLDTHYTNAYDA